MPNVSVAFIGAGSIRNSAPVIAALAIYFGERPLEIVLYDADEERLDLFDRFARTSFILMNSTHSLRATTELAEALHDASAVVVGYDENCARKELGKAAHRLTASQAMSALRDRIADLVPEGLPVLCLPHSPAIEGADVSEHWPETLEQPSYVVPLQILRWLNGEEYPYDLFRENQGSPLRDWLDDPKLRPVTS